MSEINPKEMALMLYKMSIENSAMLKQILAIQTELMKMMKIVHFGTNSNLSEKISRDVELLFENSRAKQCDYLYEMLPLLETITKETLAIWMSKAIETGELAGSKKDYEFLIKLIKTPVVSTASHG